MCHCQRQGNCAGEARSWQSTGAGAGRAWHRSSSYDRRTAAARGCWRWREPADPTDAPGSRRWNARPGSAAIRRGPFKNRGPRLPTGRDRRLRNGCRRPRERRDMASWRQAPARFDYRPAPQRRPLSGSPGNRTGGSPYRHKKGGPSRPPLLTAPFLPYRSEPIHDRTQRGPEALRFLLHPLRFLRPVQYQRSGYARISIRMAVSLRDKNGWKCVFSYAQR